VRDLLHDLRVTFRIMRRRPLLTVSVVAILGLGIGANTAIFQVFSATFLRPLPFAHEEQLVRVYVSPASGAARISPRSDVFLGIREEARSFVSVVGQRFMDMTLTGPSGPERVTGIAVTPDWPRTLGLQPFRGRTFDRDEERLGLAAGVTVISYAAWRDRFGADPAVLGRSVRLDGVDHVVVGVMPPGLRYPYEADFWVPMTLTDDPNATWGYNIQARLRDGVSLAEARAELRALSPRLPAVARLGGMQLVAYPLREVLVGNDGRLVAVLLAAVGFLLLIVCANVAHLMLAENISRRHEFALRSALGATRGRNVRQILTETTVVAALGGGVGLLLALVGASLLTVLLPTSLSQVFAGPPLDAHVAWFTLAVSLGTGLVAGLVPSVWVAGRGVRSLLRGVGHGTVRAGLGRVAPALIVSELALALTLLSGAGALFADLVRRQSLDLGYRSEGLLTLNVALNGDAYREGARRTAFLERALAGIRALPGIDAAAAVTTFPAEGQGTFLSSLEFEGRPPQPDAPVIAHNRLVTDGYFATMGMPLIRGRAIETADGASAPAVTVVSRSVADRYWPGEDPIGKRVRAHRDGDPGPWHQVIGVVDDVHEFYTDTDLAWYVPFAQNPDGPGSRQAVFVVRAPVTSPGIIQQVRGAIGNVDPALAVFDVAGADVLYRRSLAARRSAGLLTALFSGIGLLVAAFGVYASVAFSVGARRRETAVRIAIGADGHRIVRAFLKEGAVLAVAGLALGVLGVLATSRWLTGLTDGRPIDLGYGMGVAALLAGVALLASYLPARRAARTDPSAELRGG